MLTKRIIACLDVDGGRVVKGTKFVELCDAGDPAELAHLHAAQGADEIVFLDITATHQNRGTLLDSVRRTARSLFIPLTVGGGIRSLGDACALFDSGADKISLNSAAIRNPALIAEISARFGSQAVMISIDAKRSPDGTSEVWIEGGRRPTGRETLDWAREAEARGAGEILLTAIDRDGTRTGFDCTLTAQVESAVSIPVIASGGAGAAEHFVDVFTSGRADAALAASIFHFGLHGIGDLKGRLQAAGILVRWPC
jgi:cyclase